MSPSPRSTPTRATVSLSETSATRTGRARPLRSGAGRGPHRRQSERLSGLVGPVASGPDARRSLQGRAAKKPQPRPCLRSGTGGAMMVFPPRFEGARRGGRAAPRLLPVPPNFQIVSWSRGGTSGKHRVAPLRRRQCGVAIQPAFPRRSFFESAEGGRDARRALDSQSELR